tara:strand:+ start:215611 stop:216354 length:744 start_codon:yes stop_codon:yes gene_type:complete
MNKPDFRGARTLGAFVILGMVFLFSTASWAQLTLEVEVSKNECERICRAGSLGYSDDTCKMAYYFVSGANAGTCRTTLDDVPNLQMRGKYRIWSGYFQRWLTNDLIAYKWPNINGPVGTSSGNQTGGNPSGGGGTGVQVNTSKVALNGSAACARTNWNSAKQWYLVGPSGGSAYYETGGYFCRSSGTGFFMTGSRYEFYSCAQGFKNCARHRPYDATLGRQTTWKPGKARIEFIWEDGSRVDHINEQ